MPVSDGLRGVPGRAFQASRASAASGVRQYAWCAIMLLSLFWRGTGSHELACFPVALSCPGPLLGISKTAKGEGGGVCPF